MSMDLDGRAIEAAAAARTSVARAAAHAVQQGAPARRARSPWTPAIAAAVVVLAGVAALVVGRGVATTRLETGAAVETGPAASAGTTPPAPPMTTLPPPPPGPPPLPRIGQPIASGTASDGQRWTLSIGGPSNELCFHLYVDERNTSGQCAGRPGGAPLPADERYRPLFQDSRKRSFVFGRMPAGVTEVEAVLESGTTPRQPVVPGADGGAVYYAIELPGTARPTAVVGYGRDGTTARHVLPA